MVASGGDMKVTCASRTNQWDKVSYTHAIAVGLGALAVLLRAGSGFLMSSNVPFGQVRDRNL